MVETFIRKSKKGDRFRSDRREVGKGGKTRGDYGAGTSPAGALAHVPLLSYKGTIRLKDGGRRRDIIFFSSAL